MEISPASSLTCTQCGGELHPDEGQLFITCPYCSSTVYLDKSKVVFHWSLNPTLNEAQAAGALARWMSGSQTVKDLDKKSRVISQTFQYFPLWYFKTGGNGSQEKIQLQPAAATSVTELAHLALPAGDLQRYDSALNAQAVDPTVPLDAAREWLQQARPGIETRESALVHIPIYIFKYTYRNETFTAVVEAATGTVLANLYPAKAEAPYLVAAGITAAVYLCVALVAAIGALNGDDGGGLFAGIAILVGLAAAPFLMAMAAWVASKI